MRDSGGYSNSRAPFLRARVIGHNPTVPEQTYKVRTVGSNFLQRQNIGLGFFQPFAHSLAESRTNSINVYACDSNHRLAYGLPRRTACLTSEIAFVTSMPRGQASEQLKVVRQRQTPSLSLRTSSLTCAPSSLESKINR